MMGPGRVQATPVKQIGTDMPWDELPLGEKNPTGTHQHDILGKLRVLSDFHLLWGSSYLLCKWIQRPRTGDVTLYLLTPRQLLSPF